MVDLKYETMNKIPKRLKKVEELFEVAEKTLEECRLPSEESTEIEVLPAENTTELTEPLQDGSDIKLPRLFDLHEVRQDFVLAKRNLHKLLHRCQSLMDGTSGMDIVEMKASQIEAIALLSNSINMQIQNVVRLYKDLADIEQMRMPPELKKVGKEQDEKTTAVYVGDSKSLLDIIEENTNG